MRKRGIKVDFSYKYKVLETTHCTTYGSVCVKNILFDPREIENILPEIIFDEENLKHMFAEEFLTDFKKRNIYRRFLPKSSIKTTLGDCVEKYIQEHKSFYSFLAEGILGLVFRDLYNYNLAKGVIDVTETSIDSHTGVDACMYSLEENVIVLGEAKFYESLNGGINKIIEDFVSKNIKNKLESLQTNAQNSEWANKIVIKNLNIGEYDELTIEQFVNQKIIFAGFVLHSEADISNYSDPNFYKAYNITVEQLKENVAKCLNINEVTGAYEIILIHLPVESKKHLIVKVMEKSREMLHHIAER